MALTLNGSDPTGDLGDLLDAKLPIAGGKILQIVRATDATARTTNSTSFTDVTGMSVTITPQKNNSAIVIVALGRAQTSSSIDTDNRVSFQITDASNNAISGAEAAACGVVNFTGTGSRETASFLNIWAYATPATTSAVTYKLRFGVNNASVTASLQNQTQTGQMYAIEVSA